MNIPEYRCRTVIPDEELTEKQGKIQTDEDYNLLATGPCRILKPDGRPLLVYLPGAIPADLNAAVYPDLTKIRQRTDNRGLASGSRRAKGVGQRTKALAVPSAIIGYYDGKASPYHCRLTAYTARETAGWERVQPLFRFIGQRFAEMVPERYQAQMEVVNRTGPDWVIPGTPFTTITVNNTYPTGVHTDKGDLDAGFSCLAVLRRGDYSGGILTFPAFRVAVDMKDGDLILMDAHEWHGNTALVKHSPDAERISVVCYYRTEMEKCDALPTEMAKAEAVAEWAAGFAAKPEFLAARGRKK